MKKTYMMPQTSVVEMIAEGMIAGSGDPTASMFNVDGGVDAAEGLVREDVAPRHDVWEEW